MNDLGRRGFIKTVGIASLSSLGFISASKPLKRPNGEKNTPDKGKKAVLEAFLKKRK